MEERLKEQFDGLLEKYTELMLGETAPEYKEKIQMWALYTFISKSMPPLVKHWNSEYPEGKEKIMKIIKEIKKLNDLHREVNGKKPGK
ncbi:DUF2573 family protein [Metabacillus sp. RGM 3146]|uniref:DUF2573 family protein n=1 Tax=Metabacillus sp. RGM 3146 TaxID=3401092 RepID=UPI003B9D713A